MRGSLPIAEYRRASAGGASPKWFKAAQVVRSLAVRDLVVAAVQDRIDIMGGQIEMGSRDPGLRGSEIGWDRH
jgi:hypothetical protein